MNFPLFLIANNSNENEMCSIKEKKDRCWEESISEKYKMWGSMVKASSTWLTYIGSLPLASQHSSSLTITGLHVYTQKDTHTHTL